MTSFISLAAPHVSINYEGKEYKLAPLTFKDLADYILWYQFKELRKAEKTTENFPPELRNKILSETYEKCLNKKYTDSEGKEYPLSWEMPELQVSLNEVDGIGYQLYLCLKHLNPEITEELADRIVTLETYKGILGKILIVQGLKPDINDEESQVGEVQSLNQ